MPNQPKRQKRRRYIPERTRRQSDYGNDAYPFYNSQPWRRCSRTYRVNNPMCSVFPHRPADVTDHIIPIEVDERGFPLPSGGAAYDERNLMSLSHKAHNIKRGKERHGFEVEKVQTVDGWIPKDRGEIVRVLRGE